MGTFFRFPGRFGTVAVAAALTASTFDFTTAASTAYFTDNVYNEDYTTVRPRSAGPRHGYNKVACTSEIIRWTCLC
jgi:hypothetical protein